MSIFVGIKLLKFSNSNGLLAENMIKYDKYKINKGG